MTQRRNISTIEREVRRATKRLNDPIDAGETQGSPGEECIASMSFGSCAGTSIGRASFCLVSAFYWRASCLSYRLRVSNDGRNFCMSLLPARASTELSMLLTGLKSEDPERRNRRLVSSTTCTSDLNRNWIRSLPIVLAFLFVSLSVYLSVSPNAVTPSKRV